MSDDSKLSNTLLERLKALETEFQSLPQDAEGAPGQQCAADDLQRTVNARIDEAIAKIEKATDLSDVDLDQVNHDTLVDVLQTIKTQRVTVQKGERNNLNLLSQHSGTRVHLLKIIDEIVELNRRSEEALREADQLGEQAYNTDYDELAKEIKQIIRSTPKLDASIRGKAS